MVIIGLDPSLTGFGYALIDTNPGTVMAAGAWATFPDRQIKTVSADNAERFAYLSKCLYEFVRDSKPEHLFVEGTVLPLGKSSMVTASTLGRCRGLVDMIAAAVDVGITELSPQTVKKGLGIARTKKQEQEGMATKEEVRTAVFKLYPSAIDHIPKTKIGENAADAVAVAHVGNLQRAFRERLSSW